MKTVPIDRAAAHQRARALLSTLARPSRAEDALRKAAAYGTALSSFVENRRRARAGREDLLPLYFVWTVSRHCNFLCEYCDDHRGRRYPELPREGELDTAAARDVLAVMRTRCPSVYFAGGEPTLRDDLPELASEARALRYFPIVLNTNGSAIVKRLHHPGFSTLLRDLDLVVVSLDALDPTVLSTMWGYPRPADVLWAIHVLAELRGPLRFRLMVNCVVQPGRVAHARAVLDFARELGIGFAPVPVNVGPAVDATLADDPEYADFVELVLARKREGQVIAGSERMLERLLSSTPLTCRNTLKPHIDHDGKLFWPCKASVAVEPVTLDVRDFAHVDALWAHAAAAIDPRGFSSRCGARCNWAQNYTTDAYAHGLVEPLSLLREVRGFVA
ncbi:MAG: radical SAM protein [Sandaracinaceae bacterium]|nr:radical SAM protein [Sandaracinaceae bacterium]